MDLPANKSFTIAKRPLPKYPILIGALIIGIIGLSLFSYRLTSTDRLKKSLKAIVPEKKPTVALKTGYVNPFDAEAQYINPFDQYKSPFHALKALAAEK